MTDPKIAKKLKKFLPLIKSFFKELKRRESKIPKYIIRRSKPQLLSSLCYSLSPWSLLLLSSSLSLSYLLLLSTTCHWCGVLCEGAIISVPQLPFPDIILHQCQSCSSPSMCSSQSSFYSLLTFYSLLSSIVSSLQVSPSNLKIVFFFLKNCKSTDLCVIENNVMVNLSQVWDCSNFHKGHSYG